MTITQEQYNAAFALSKDSYEENVNNLPSNYVYNAELSIELDSGFKANVYYNETTQKYTVAFRGTDANIQGDIKCDVQMATGEIPDQFDQAKGFMESLALPENGGITADQIEMITGHSKGGSLAQMIGSLEEYSSITTVTMNAYGTEHLHDDLVERPDIILGDYSNIHNFGDAEDLVFRADDQVGKTYTLNSDTTLTGVLYDLSTTDYLKAIYQGLINSTATDNFNSSVALQNLLNSYGGNFLGDHTFGELEGAQLSEFNEGEIQSFQGEFFIRGFKPLIGGSIDASLNQMLRMTYPLIVGSLALTPIFNFFSTAEDQMPAFDPDPMILDLDGDGIETTTLENGVYFDHDNNGFAETSAWVGNDDGLLAVDTNGDGVINNGTELIKNFADLAGFDTNTKLAA